MEDGAAICEEGGEDEKAVEWNDGLVVGGYMAGFGDNDAEE